MKILFVGDLHYKANNTAFCSRISSELLVCVDKEKPDVCVLAGDLLHTHERLHQTPYNLILELIEGLQRLCSSIYILVGNHDYENNQQFLTNKHWMNALKQWRGVTIVDRVYRLDEDILFVPYVPPGRFIEALDTMPGWLDSTRLIFAHQEFRGCLLDICTSIHGDKWPASYPIVYSGHIHKAHRLKKNIIYPGSVIQHTFGEMNNTETGICIIDTDGDLTQYKRVSIKIPTMREMKVTSLEELKIALDETHLDPLDRVRVKCIMSEREYQLASKLVTVPLGAKLVRVTTTKRDDREEEEEHSRTTFMDALMSRLDDRLRQLYTSVYEGKTHDELVSEV